MYRVQNRDQATLLPERLDDLIGDDNAVRLIDAFVDSLDLKALGFARIETKGTGRPTYHPGDLLKLYLYGYMYRIRSCRRLERECHKNTEVLWLLSRLTPDFKTIANLRVANRDALLRVCAAFVTFCRSQSSLGGDTIAIDGGKFTADNAPSPVLLPIDDLDHAIVTLLARINAERGVMTITIELPMETVEHRSQDPDG